ncbi:MAG: OmpA family protein [Helicobacteraceae bacterium]|nr:OmpA family protein [Helicobacteraceae bacterium]
MTKVILTGATVALLMLSGCSSKNASINGASGPIAGGTEVVEEVLALDENGVAIVDLNDMNMLGLERQMKSIYFDFDKYVVRADMQENMQFNSELADSYAKDYTLKLEGNCDEWGSDEYNYALGLKRANATKKDAVASGVSADRITMMSYGKSNPVCSEKTKDCWSKNRRVDFRLLP